MQDLASLAVTWGILSGLAVGVLGAVSLTGGRQRTRGALPFGLFAIAWGIQVIAITVAGVSPSSGLAFDLYMVTVAGLLPMPFFLFEFAGTYTQADRSGLGWRSLRSGFGAVALVGAGLLAFEPGLILEGTRSWAGGFAPRWGPLEPYLLGLPRVLSFGGALLVLYRAMATAPTSRTRNRLAALIGGLSLYVGYLASSNLVVVGGIALSTPNVTNLLFAGSFVGLSVAVVGLAIHGWIRARREPLPRDRRRELLIASALAVPWTLGLVEGIFVPDLFRLLNPVGAWRLAGVGVIAYGLARWRIYDLPERVHGAAASATGAAGALAGGATTYGAATALTSSAAIPLVGGVVVTLASLLPGIRLARNWLGPDEPDNPVEQDRQRFEKRIEAYRAALEASMARGTLDEDAAFLDGLREEFDISEREDRIVRYYARQAVVPTREGDPDHAYERLRILGEGGAGRTWLARDRARDRLVVLKEPLDRWQREPRVLDAARREAELAAKIRHPNVVEVEAVIEDDGLPVLVMEYVPGGTLADRLHAEGVIGWRDGVAITHDVAQGLDAVHDAGIVHRDLKPSNVLLDDEGRAKITDFGIARDQASGQTRVVEDAPSLGTDAYMAPEVRAGASSGDERADVYGCAALLYTCLHGSPPSDGGPVVVDNEVPAELERVLAKGLAVRPEDRYESARALATALAKVADA